MGNSTAGGLLSGVRGISSPKRLHVLGNHVEVRFAAVGIDPDQILAAIGQAKLIKTGPRELERLRGGGFLQRKRALAIGITNFHSPRLPLGGPPVHINLPPPVPPTVP